jgi:hypothetical protein
VILDDLTPEKSIEWIPCVVVRDQVLTTATADDVGTAVPREDDVVGVTTKPDPISPTTGFRVIGPAARVQQIPASRTEETVRTPVAVDLVVAATADEVVRTTPTDDHVVASAAAYLVIPARPDKAIVAGCPGDHCRRSINRRCQRPSHTQARDSRRNTHQLSVHQLSPLVLFSCVA